MEPLLSLLGINKSFGQNVILSDLRLDVFKGEFITLLGPSGCGKTTCLRIIAGLEHPDSGTVILNGVNITAFEPNRRSVNTVFQNYALFPHLNVYRNIAYGLKIRGVPSSEIAESVRNALALVRMEGYERRRPSELSGGQRQRVALARALVNKPDILLLDEPLGALDLKLRRHMQAELKRIQRDTDATFIYVTHDQDEALNMSDRVAVLHGGRVEQAGAPEEIYQKPSTRFVAEFVGDRNIINGRAVHADKTLIGAAPFGGVSIPGTVTETGYTGAAREIFVEADTGEVLKSVEYNAQTRFSPGERVFVSWHDEDSVSLPEDEVQ